MTSPLARVRSLLGLATLGEGLFIFLRVVPHESPLLGAALIALGALLLWRAELPRLERAPLSWSWVIGGLAAALGVLVYDACAAGGAASLDLTTRLADLRRELAYNQTFLTANNLVASNDRDFWQATS